ncbi:MAG: hypothetical protein CM15mP79_2550 [Methanobacteriota archaeon]|nr:MAG: hypothetical protein CM15mP79_2550 [Euryarchaeota archaeon]
MTVLSRRVILRIKHSRTHDSTTRIYASRCSARRCCTSRATTGLAHRHGAGRGTTDGRSGPCHKRWWPSRCLLKPWRNLPWRPEGPSMRGWAALDFIAMALLLSVVPQFKGNVALGRRRRGPFSGPPGLSSVPPRLLRHRDEANQSICISTSAYLSPDG